MKSKIENLLHSSPLGLLKKIVLVILVAAAAIPFQNCGTPPDDIPPVVDTTKKVVEPINTFKFNNIKTYSLKWDSTNMFGTYRVGTDFTTIIVEGYSAGTYASFILKFPGKTLGTFKYSVIPEVNIEINIDQGVKHKQYIYQPEPGRDMIINVTKYDPVGGKISGTFSGQLQESGSLPTGNITAGAFEVRRDQDEL